MQAIRYTDAAHALGLSRWRVYQLAKAGKLTELVIPGHVKLLTLDSVLSRGGVTAQARLNLARVILLKMTPGDPSPTLIAQHRPPNPQFRCCRVCGTPTDPDATPRTPCPTCSHVGKAIMTASRSRLYLEQYRVSHEE